MHVAVVHIQLCEVHLIVELFPQCFECRYDVSGSAHGCVCSRHVNVHANLHWAIFGSLGQHVLVFLKKRCKVAFGVEAVFLHSQSKLPARGVKIVDIF